jgi:hypothetical protein
MKKMRIFITTQFEATHQWKLCPFPEVSFLKDPHRHMFHVRLEKVVHHDDRDVEFIMLKREVTAFVRLSYEGKDLGSMSCEVIAGELMEAFDACRVEVSEDGENGAILTK